MSNNIIDFLGDEADFDPVEAAAVDWLIKLDGDQSLTDIDRQQLQQWIEQDAGHREALERLADIWECANVLTVLALPAGSVSEKPEAGFFIRQLAATISTLNRAGALAALVVVAISVALYSVVFQGVALDSTNGSYATAVGEQRSQILADGSALMLNTYSEAEVVFQESRRIIYLTRGEAHFDVAHDKSRPFQVYADGRLVEAVGTAFTVYLQSDKAVKVTVTEGRVKLAEQATPQAPVAEALAFIGKAQTVTVVPAKSDIAVVPKPQTLSPEALKNAQSWRRGMVMFNGEPLAEVIAEISRYSDLEIIITDPALKTLSIGGQFRVGETDAMLAVLAANSDLQVNRLDNGRVEISAKAAY